MRRAAQDRPLSNAARVSVRYGDTALSASPGEPLLDVILRAGLAHRHVCGGHGFCTSCRVEVVRGEKNLSPVSSVERQRLPGQAGKMRLACQTRVYASVEVRVPAPRTHGYGPLSEES